MEEIVEYKIEYIAVSSIQKNKVKDNIKEFLEGQLYAQVDEEGDNYIVGSISRMDLSTIVSWKELPSEIIFTIVGIGNAEIVLNHFKKIFEEIADQYFESHILIYSDIGRCRCINSYEELHVLENDLRVFIIKTLISKYGGRWWEERVSEEIKKRPRKRKQKELNSQIYDSEDMHYIYYSDFKHLKEIIEDESNWIDIYEDFFGELGILFKLTELEGIRHKIAHNRYLTERNKTTLELYHWQINKCIKPHL